MIILRVSGFLCVVCVCLVSFSHAQHSIDIGLERDINRYRWTAGVNSAASAGNWRMTLRNDFSSDAYVLFSDQLLFRDENRLDWQASRRASPALDFIFKGGADWFSLSRVFIQDAVAGVRYRWTPQFSISPAIGYAIDQRPGISKAEQQPAPLRADAGPALSVESIYTNVADDDSYAVNIGARGDYHRIQPRQGHALRAAGSGMRRVESSRFDSRIVASSFRRDTYQAVSFLNRDAAGPEFSESIEQTTTDTLNLEVAATVPLGNGFHFGGSSDLTANGRSVRSTGNPEETLFFDTRFDRRSFNFQGSLAYSSRRHRLQLSSSSGVEEESRTLTNRDELPAVQAIQKSNLLRQADYDRGHFSLSGSARSELARRYVTSVSATARILNHNTPETNPDDRDEVFFTGRAGVLIHLSPELLTDVVLHATRYETVYLKAQRSAENNVQRSLRLNPSVTWKPNNRSTFRLASEVRATYTVDQFTLPGRRPRDQSARELRYEFDAERDIGDYLAVIVNVSYSTLHLGRFIEETFAEIPFDTLRINKLWLRLRAGGVYTADFGIRAFIRSDYNQSTSVSYQPLDQDGIPAVDPEGNPVTTTISRPGRNIIRQVGPTCTLVWPMNNRSSLRLDGWLIFQRVFQRLYGDLPDLNAERIRHRARRGKLTTIPNLTMAIRWTI